MNILTKVLPPTLLIAANAAAMTVTHTPAWTETYEEPVYRTVAYPVEHVHRGFFHDSVTYTTEVRSVLDHYETRSEVHPDLYTQIDDRGIAATVTAETFATYATGRAIILRPGVRTTVRTNSRMIAGDPNDRVVDLGPQTVVTAVPPVVIPAPVIVQPAPVVIAPPPPVVVVHPAPPPAIIIDVRGGRHRW